MLNRSTPRLAAVLFPAALESQSGLRGSGYTNPRYPTRPKDIHLENLENTHTAFTGVATWYR